MSFKIEYSPIAIRDLDRVYAEVLEASKAIETAIRYVGDLMDCVAEKRDFPRPGSPLYYEGGFTGYYFVVFNWKPPSTAMTVMGLINPFF